VVAQSPAQAMSMATVVPAAMADKLIAVLSCLPNTTYDLPADDLLFGSA
jgi:hypothetical protein